VNSFIDEIGVIRARSRIKNANLSIAAKHPIILPDSSHFTKLLIRKYHKDVFHMGIQTTLSRIREKYMILRGRRIVKSIINNCFICKKFNSRNFDTPFAQLPKCRLSAIKPFDTVGIDFAGQLFIKNNVKIYICLFTCTAIRAIHLKIVSDLTTDSFTQALRRFIPRRGLCKTIICDNAKTFKCADLDLRMLWRSITHPDTKRLFGDKSIKFKYLVERAP